MEIVKYNGLAEIFSFIVSKIHRIKYEMNNHEQKLLSSNNCLSYNIVHIMYVVCVRVWC